MPAVPSASGSHAAPAHREPSFASNVVTPSQVAQHVGQGGGSDRPGIWSSSDRWLIAVSLLLMTGLLTTHLWRDQQRRATPVAIVHPHGTYQFQVALNSATWVEWAQLDGIGETLARRIIADREANGPFTTIDDLRRVKGIGPKTLDKLRPFVVVEPSR